MISSASLFLFSCTVAEPPRTSVSGHNDPETIIVDQLPPENAMANEEQSGTGTAIPERLLETGILEVGSRSAPVSLLIFTNHACPYCRQFERELMPGVLREFVQTQKIRVGIVPVPLQKYPLSEEQARRFLCAASQGKGWAMHQVLSDATEPPDIRPCPEEEISRLRAIQLSLIRSMGVRLLPLYMIDGQTYEGFPEWADLKAQIEDAL